jgi:hypothetical protein
MDLWYDLAVRELSNLDAHVTELIEDEETNTKKTARDTGAAEVVAVGSF